MMADPSRDMVKLYVLMAMLLLMAFVGICGNTLALVVYFRKKDKLTSTTFILGLAVIDCFTCAVIIPFTIYIEYVGFIVTSDFSCKLYWFLQLVGLPFSAFMIGAIAVDRYFCICHPFLQAINQERAKIIIIALAIVAFALGLVGSLGYGIREETPDVLNETIQTYNGVPVSTDLPKETMKIYNITAGHCTMDDALLSPMFMINIYTYLSLSLYFLSLAVVSILYLAIYCSVIHRREHRMKQKALLPRGNSMPTKIIGARSNHDDDDDKTELSRLETQKTQDSPTRSKNSAKLPSDDHFQNNGCRKANLTCDDTNNIEVFKEGVPGALNRGIKNKDKMRLANLKTAGMLFIVSIIFFGTYLPALLMILNVIGIEDILFYLYYLNNVCNPIIYAFMNQNFRDDLKLLFECRRNRRLVRRR